MPDTLQAMNDRLTAVRIHTTVGMLVEEIEEITAQEEYHLLDALFGDKVHAALVLQDLIAVRDKAGAILSDEVVPGGVVS